MCFRVDSIVRVALGCLLSTLCIGAISYAQDLDGWSSSDYDIPDVGNHVCSDVSFPSAPGNAEIAKIGIYYEIRHTYPGDLDVWITFYDEGSWHDYYLYNEGDLGGTDDIVETRNDIHVWDGFSPNQTFYLCVQDRLSGDVGYIDFFEIWIWYDENRCPDEPSSPFPSNGATSVSVNANLDWSCSDPDGDVLYYTVYFGTEEPLSIIKDDQTGSHADPGTLEEGTTYYWYVVADDHNGCVSFRPTAWSFETEQTVEIVSFSPPTGLVHRGDQTLATVRVRNGSSSGSYWVGLSFAEHWVDVNENPGPWPDGWYDVRPQQTDVLSPGETQDLFFQFKIPPTLPAGTYTARTAVWGGYNAELHLMSEPRYDVRDMQSFGLNDYPNPMGDLESQLLDIVSFVAFDELPFGGMAERYHSEPGRKCEKVLLYFRLTADATLFGVPVMAGGSLLIDLADLFNITPEGRDDKWVSVWIDAHGGIKMSATGINVDIGLSHHMFNYGEEALADYRRYISGEVSGQVGYIVFSGLGWDQGFQFPKLKVVTGFGISCEATGTWQELTSLEINKERVRDALAQANGNDLHDLRDAILDYFLDNVGNEYIRDKTEDDGNIWVESEQGDWTHDLRCDRAGYAHYFFTEISNNSELRLVTANGSGDANMYVKYRERPTLTSYDYRSVNSQTNEESIRIPSPSSDYPWYIMIYAREPYSGLNLSVRYDPTDVEEIESPTLPATFSLSQNYPNPFNPETRIEFDLPHSSFVSIDIINLLGQRVRTLVFDRLSAGYKAVTWDGRNDGGSDVSSGIYLYRIVTGGFTQSRKMVLLR